MSEPVISVSHFSKYYLTHQKEPGFTGSIKSLFVRKTDTVKAVQDISFSINEGELIGFIGPNGAGKTTTLKSLSGLLYPTSGEINVLGYTPFERKNEFLKQISLVMGQKNQLWWDLPAMDTFLLTKEIYGVPDKQFRTIVNELAGLLDAGELLRIPVKKLSLGQRMKMELITALIHSPKILFLDEPTIGLDVVMQKKIREFLKEYNRKFNATIILTSHYMGDVEELAKRVIIINFGRILYDGSLAELVRKKAPYKTIAVTLQKAVDPRKLEGFGKLKKFEFPQWQITVPIARTNEVAAKILSVLPVDDVTIEDPDLEDVIRAIFDKERRRNDK